MKHLSVKVTGKVQGVFFRASTKDVAKKFGISGFVCNHPDGSVVIEAEGEEENLNQFMEWCHHGPLRAIVDSVIIEFGDLMGFKKFEVRH